MDITGVCLGVVVVIGVIFIILAVVHARNRAVIQERENLAYQEVVEALKLDPIIFRVSLINVVEGRLIKIKPELISWTYYIDGAISRSIEEGWVEQKRGILYAHFPKDG